jgi:hypothetical protein
MGAVVARAHVLGPAMNLAAFPCDPVTAGPGYAALGTIPGLAGESEVAALSV